MNTTYYYDQPSKPYILRFSPRGFEKIMAAAADYLNRRELDDIDEDIYEYSSEKRINERYFD